MPAGGAVVLYLPLEAEQGRQSAHRRSSDDSRRLRPSPAALCLWASWFEEVGRFTGPRGAFVWRKGREVSSVLLEFERAEAAAVRW